ncbi:MAG: DUF2283 domain-containing protein [Planctomycetes bacterium]|nr:DUF2283 domain-containing protein [Planctomycetota bacterium]
MKLHYYKETDSLYIDLSSKTSVDSKEISPGVVLDYSEDDQIVGIDIQQASQVVDLSIIEADEIPIKKLSFIQK